jgi:acyl-CoA synthetase (AMP-forming)/AMP-acid ligase II
MQQTGRDLWQWRVQQTPDRPFVRFGEREWTYAEFDDDVRRLAAGLAGIGVGAGARVLVAMANAPETIMVHVALHQLGAAFVPLLPGLTSAELAFPINHSEARLLIADKAVGEQVLEMRDQCPALERIVLTDELAEIAVAQAPAPAPLDGYDEDSLAAILYTSGSTGRPKGVMIRAGSYFSVGDAFADRFGVTSDDTYFLPTTLSHAVGCLTAVSMTMQRGGTLAIVERFSPSSFWSQLADAGGTYSILFPAQLNLLLEAAGGAPAAGEHSLRLVITHAYIGRFRERFGVELATVWGMTETGALCVGSESGYLGEHGDNYVGVPMKAVEVAVLDERLNSLGPGQNGEIALRHRHVMLGYLKDPEATKQTLVDGWVRSGDLGVLDDEGRLFFVGRLKNVIKRSGENISAEEVEAALAEHSDVAESTVFAVPDPIRTEEVYAVVVRRQGTVADPVSVRTFCAETLVRWKLPRYIMVRDEPLPRLPSGKLDRVALRASLDGVEAWDAQAVRSKSRAH